MGKGGEFMKNQLNANQVGLVVGVSISLFHFIWGLFVAFGIAQVILDFIYSIHFLNNPFTVANFDLVKWVTLLLVTFVVGYIFGYLFTLVWNRLHK